MNSVGAKRDMVILDYFDKEDLAKLIETQQGPCVSIFLPTERKGKEVRQNPIRYKNALEHAKTLTSQSGSTGNVDLSPARGLIEDNGFWKTQEAGLALFASPDVMRVYRLPIAFEETVVASSNRFHVKPVLPLTAYNLPFYLLVVSQKNCRFYRCDRRRRQEIEPKNFPRSLSESLQYDLQEKQVQFHTGAQPSNGGGKRAAMFHGQGVADDEDKDRILRHFQVINKAVTEYLGSTTDPLIVAGIDYLHPLYKEANTYPFLHDDGVKGNPDNRSDLELHAEAWKIMEPLTRNPLHSAVKKYHDLKGTGKTDCNLLRILPESLTGRISHLIFPVDFEQWGSFDMDTARPEIHPEKEPKDEDLINVAAFHAINMGAEAFPVTMSEMPDSSPAVAIFRY